MSENVFLSANHFRPSTNSTVTFHATNDPLVSSITRTVSGGQRVDNTDIWVGVLDSPVAPGYTHYDISLTPNITQNAYLTGRSESSLPATQDIAVGRNILTGIIQGISVESSTADAIAAFNEVPSGGVTFESIVVNGDSGAPLFVADPVTSNFIIAGTNWFEGLGSFTSADQTFSGDFSGFTNLSSQRDAILDIIATNAVPEPSSTLLLSLTFMSIITKRKR